MSDGVDQLALRVMVVDDHPMWREAVERDLQDAGFDVVAVAADGHQAIARFRAARPQVVVLDLQIPGPGGVEVTADVLGRDPSARVLILSASGEQRDVLEAVKAGATGYLVKSASRQELIEAVRRVAVGDAVFTPGLAGLVLGEFRRINEGGVEPEPEHELTPRETEILKMVAKSRDSRFSDTTALRAAIDQARNDDGKKASSFRLPFSDPRLMGLLGVVAVAVVGAVVYLLVR